MISKNLKKVIELVECCDHKEGYGYLEFEGASETEVQNKIYEIKNNPAFIKKHPDWTIEDVLKFFPKKWKTNFITAGSIKIIEI